LPVSKRRSATSCTTLHSSPTTIWAMHIYKKGDYDKAIESYKLALRSSHSYTLCYSNLARAYEAKGELEEAIASYKQCVFYFPKDSAAHLGLGKVFLKLGKSKEAKEELNLTIWADPAGPQAKEARERLKKLNIE